MHRFYFQDFQTDPLSVCFDHCSVELYNPASKQENTGI